MVQLMAVMAVLLMRKIKVIQTTVMAVMAVSRWKARLMEETAVLAAQRRAAVMVVTVALQ
jgi:hypothetical protein